MNQAVPQKRMKPSTKLALLVLPVIIISASWLLWQELQQSPIRQAGVQLPAYGVVTVQLTTEPFPAVASEPVQMTLRLAAPGGRMTMVERVTYTYGPQNGSDIFQGETREVAMETFQGPLQFTDAGDWWIYVNIEDQGTVGEAKFTIPVKANR
jgi:hypothetical protein